MGTARRDHFNGYKSSPVAAPESAPEAFAPVARVRWLAASSFLILLVLAARLYYLQVMLGDRYHDQADSNRTRTVRSTAPRGVVTDCDGNFLVSNTAQFTVFVDPDELPKAPAEREAVLNRLAGIVGLSADDLAELKDKTGTADTPNGISAKEARRSKRRAQEPVAVAEGVDKYLLAKIGENEWQLPGVIKAVDPVRSYNKETFAAHLLGYIGPVTEDDLKNPDVRARGYRAGDFIGKDGVEKTYDKLLSGTEGDIDYEIDARGRRKRQLADHPPTIGATLKLTIEREVQQAAEDGLKGKIGAAVALDPHTGAVLAMASAPNFDPNQLARRPLLSRTWQVISDKKTTPLVNRAIAAAEPPGSTFKIITSAAALGTGTISPSTSFVCGGGMMIGHYFKHCDGEHGVVDLKRGLAQSCDSYYYHVGINSGPDAIADWASKFGIGKPTGVDLPHEQHGRMPTRAWRRKAAVRYKGDPAWYPGDTANIAIGQGDIIATPLQIAALSEAIANHGTIYKPYVVASATNINREVIYRAKPVVASKLPLSPANLQAIAEGLRAVVTSGTSKAAEIPGIAVAGKSGTPEKKSQATGQNTTLAWFTCYAPYENPQIVVCVLIYSAAGGEHLHGGVAAAPLAKAMILAHMGRAKRGMGAKPVVLAAQ